VHALSADGTDRSIAPNLNTLFVIPTASEELVVELGQNWWDAVSHSATDWYG